MLFSNENMILETKAKEESREVDEEFNQMRKLLMNQLDTLDLSVRALNCLKAADLKRLADLVVIPGESDLLKYRNFGQKSLTEIKKLMQSKGLSFGMNIAKYRIDEDLSK